MLGLFLEMARTQEDVLARRTQALFPNARAALRMASRGAAAHGFRSMISMR